MTGINFAHGMVCARPRIITSFSKLMSGLKSKSGLESGSFPSILREASPCNDDTGINSSLVSRSAVRIKQSDSRTAVLAFAFALVVFSCLFPTPFSIPAPSKSGS